MLYGDIFHTSYIAYNFASRKSSYVLEGLIFFKILWTDTQNMLLWYHCKLFYSVKMFGIIGINKSMKKLTSNFNFLLKSSQGLTFFKVF